MHTARKKKSSFTTKMEINGINERTNTTLQKGDKKTGLSHIPQPAVWCFPELKVKEYKEKIINCLLFFFRKYLFMFNNMFKFCQQTLKECVSVFPSGHQVFITSVDPVTAD